jgi:hypothetical protein
MMPTKQRAPSEHVVKVWAPQPVPRWRWACTCGAQGASTDRDTARDQAIAHRATHD